MVSENIAFKPSENGLSVGILVLPESNMLSLASCIDPLRAANRRAGKKLFQWQLFSPDGGEIELTSGIPIPTQKLAQHKPLDILVLVAGFNLPKYAKPPLLQQLRIMAPKLDAIGAVDGGGWLLARSGLLHGHTATVHWEDLEEFQDVFPDINVVQDRFTISGKFFTTGGAAPAIDMMLHLIRSRLGPRFAQSVASAFIYDETNSAATPQVPISTVRLRKTAPKVARVIALMADSLEEPPSISELARRVGMTARGLELVFRKTLGQSPGSFYLNFRLQEARRLVLDSSDPMQVIGLKVGFGSQAAFSRAFRREFGYSPRALRNLHR